MHRILLLIFLLFPAAGTAAADDSYYIGSRTGTDLYDAPRSSAKVIAHLPRKTDVTVLQRQRNWWKVKPVGSQAAVTGWLPEGAVYKRYQPPSKKNSGAILFSSIASLFRSPEPEQKTAVLGVRGLEDEGELAAGASEDAQRLVKWMEGLNIPDREVAAFIEEGDLNP